MGQELLEVLIRSSPELQAERAYLLRIRAIESGNVNPGDVLGGSGMSRSYIAPADKTNVEVHRARIRTTADDDVDLQDYFRAKQS